MHGLRIDVTSTPEGYETVYELRRQIFHLFGPPRTEYPADNIMRVRCGGSISIYYDQRNRLQEPFCWWFAADTREGELWLMLNAPAGWSWEEFSY